MYSMRELRARKGISQKKLAELVEVSVVSINKYENKVSYPSIKIALRIAEVLEEKVEEIDW